MLVATLPAASSANSFQKYGPHFGFTSGPDQVVFGGHLQFGDVAPSLDFVPSVDLGFGDDRTAVSINGDFHYRLDTGTKWQPYLGGGVGIHFISRDNAGPNTDDSYTDTGGHFIAGADVATKSSSRFFVEGRFGFSDSPNFKALVGWSFGGK
jgi:hypothetical protein